MANIVGGICDCPLLFPSESRTIMFNIMFSFVLCLVLDYSVEWTICPVAECKMNQLSLLLSRPFGWVSFGNIEKCKTRSDQTVFFGLQISLHHRSLSSIDEKISLCFCLVTISMLHLSKVPIGGVGAHVTDICCINQCATCMCLFYLLYLMFERQIYLKLVVVFVHSFLNPH